MYGEGKEKMVGIWKTQVNGKTKGLDAGDEKLVVSVREVPIWEEIEGSSGANGAQATAVNGDVTSGANGAGTTVAGSAKDAQTQPTSSQPQPAQPQITPASKIRHDWYQTTSHITLTILVKNAPKDTTSITIQPTSVGISIPITASSSYELSLDPLFASIVPEGSKYRTLGTKIEITLEKGEKGVKWHALEAAEPTFSENTMQDHNGQNVKGGVKDPYTHKAGKTAVNWDAVGRKPPKKGAEKGEKASMSDAGDASAEKEKPQVEEIDDDEFECSPSIKPTDTTTNESSTPANTTAKNGSTKTSPTEDNPDEYYDSEEESSGDPNYFFKKLFAGADDNVKKAMMKSYQESGGTALSTNWEDVSKGRVPVEPPEGMEAREWEGARSKRGKR